MASSESKPLLQVEDLSVFFGSKRDPVRAVDRVSFSVPAGETVALVGESGCGKSVTSMALARLVPEPPGRYESGRVWFEGQDVLQMNRDDLQNLRGNDISYVFQEPSSALNPVFRIGYQIAESLRLHRPDVNIDEEVIGLLKMVGIPDPENRVSAYPHEMSGGMQQRVVIAIALACRPKLLVADEPTTALDVTIQAQILELLVRLQKELGMAVLLITHNLGLVADIAHSMNVMYAGRLVESGPAEQLLSDPKHPYTRALLQAVPKLEKASGRLHGIPGSVPNPAHLPPGCRFHPRCGRRQERCEQEEPEQIGILADRQVRCHFWDE